MHAEPQSHSTQGWIRLLIGSRLGDAALDFASRLKVTLLFGRVTGATTALSLVIRA